MAYSLPIKVFDFFAGCGGTSQGLLNAGMDIVFAIDNDPDAARTYTYNFPSTKFVQKDIQRVRTHTLKSYIESNRSYPILFSGCAPCQPFTKQNTVRKKNDARVNLLNHFKRFVSYYQPEFVFIENVPGLQKVQNVNSPFKSFIKRLETLGYHYDYDIVASMAYGVPQKRRRLILIASRLGEIELPPKTHGPGTRNPQHSTVRESIGHLPPITAGETHPKIANHRAAKLSRLNLERIQSIPEGGDRRDWPEHLRLECHTNGYTGHTDVYGRMLWDYPATGLTTRCNSLSNGRFGHPDQDRAISLREAACLQMFPEDFAFHGSMVSISRQIGNAVPIGLAEVIGKHFLNHLNPLG